MTDIARVRCQNRETPHFFDGNRFLQCPFCGANKEEPIKRAENFPTNVDVPISMEDVQKKVGKGGFFRKWKSGNESKPVRGENISGGGQSEVTVSVYDSFNFTPNNNISEGNSDNRFMRSAVSEKPNNTQIEQNKKETDVKNKEKELNVKEQKEASNQKKRITDLDEVKTVSAYASEEGEEPVTGWIVCIEGTYKGRSFQLKTGKNVIGRDQSTHVCLKKDEQASRKHAVVIYEPKKKMFFIEEADGLVYCNDELISGRKELAIYDVIEMGKGKYVFIPFCGNRFDWNTQE